MLSYRLDAADRLVDVDDTWDDFARANDAPELVRTAVLGRRIWEFVVDESTRAVYELLFRRTRATGQTLRFPLRCDAPDRLRLLDVEITPAGGDSLVIRTQLVREEPRSPLPLLDRRVPRSDARLEVCAWCARLRLPASDLWVALEHGCATLRLFEQARLPEVNHGMCPRCLAEFDEG